MKKVKQIILIMLIATMLIFVTDNQKTQASTTNPDFEFWFKTSNDSTSITKEEWDTEHDQYNSVYLELWIKSLNEPKILGGFSASLTSSDSVDLVFSQLDEPILEVQVGPNTSKLKYFTDISNYSNNNLSVSLSPSINQHINNAYIPLEGVKLGTVGLKNKSTVLDNFQIKLENISASDQYSEISYNVLARNFVVGDITVNPTIKSLSVKGINSNQEYITSSNFPNSQTENISVHLSYLDSQNGVNVIPELTSLNATYELSNLSLPIQNNTKQTITVKDKEETKIYEINYTVEPESLNNDLLSITTSSGNLTPLFDKGIKTYELRLSYQTTSIILNAEVVDQRAILKINNQTRKSISLNNLVVGLNKVTFHVINQIGEINEYVVNIYREEPSNETGLNHLRVNGTDIYVDGLNEFSYEIEESKTNFNFNTGLKDSKVKSLQYSIDNGLTYQSIRDNVNSSSFALNKGQSKQILIRVVAEDNTEKIYSLNVNRPLSSLTEIDSLKITEGQQTTLVNALNGTYTYKKSQTTNELFIDVVAKEYATVRFNSQYMTNNRFDLSNLNEGTYTVEIIIEAQNGYLEKTYFLNIVIESDKKELELIKILDRDNAYNELTGLVYNEQTKTYSVTYDFEQISKVQIELKASDKAIITRQAGISISNDKTNYVTGQYDFTNSNLMGSLTLDVSVTAENGSIENYKIIINRKAADTNKTLEVFSINQQSVSNFIENQAPISGGYGTIIVPGNTTNINIFAVATSTKSVITYNGSTNPNISLTRGVSKQVSIRVTAQDSTYYEYIVHILAANTNNEITNIVVRNNQSQVLPLAFNQNTLEYDLEVTYPTTSINILASTPQNSFSKLTIGNTQSGNLLLNEGLNIIEVYATSESGEKGLVYIIRVTRQSARTNNDLATLVISSSGFIHTLTPGFNPSILTYQLRVDDNISNITVNASVLDNGSKIISGLGVHNLTSGQTSTISIVVESEAGINKTYLIEVKRANQINTLDSVTIEGITYTLTNDFNQNILTLNKVNYNKISLETLITLTDSKATFTTSSNYQAGIWQLKDGQNELVITVTAQDGSINPTKYIIRVEKQLPDLTKTLSDLVLYAEGTTLNLIKDFSSNKFFYEVRVNHNISKVEIIPTLQSINSSFSITPKDSVTTLTLYPNNTTFIIRVYDQTNQNYLDYTVVVMRADDNNEITDIKTNLDVDFEFNPEVINYNLGNVLFNVTSIEFNIIKSSAWSTLLINNQVANQLSNVNLKTGLNTIKIEVTSEFGTKGKTYTFEINREVASTDTSLKNLSISHDGNILLFEELAKKDFIYQLRVDRNIGFININYDKSHPNQKISITPNNGGTLVAGQATTFIIEVIAEDNLTKSFYRISVTSKNDNKEFEDITINGLALSSIATYNEISNAYILNDAYTYDVSKITIDAHKQDIYANLTGIGERTLNYGVNIFEVYNTSEFGTRSESIYIEVIRNYPNDDSSLDDLFVSGYTFDQAFNKNITNYTIKLTPQDQTTLIDINAIIATSPTNQKVLSGKVGQQVLPNQNNFNVSFQIIVKAEDNTQTIYTINVIKENNASSNAEVNYITVDGVTYFMSDFINNTLNIGQVIYSKQTLDIKVFTIDPKSTITGQIGIQEIKEIGINNFKFKVIAEDSKTGIDIEYTIQVIKLDKNTNNQLDNLSIIHDNKEILQDFNPSTNNYSFNISTNIKEILINYTKNNLGQKVSGDTGLNSLEEGLNIFKIFVQSEDNVIRTYTINITKLSSNTDITNDDVNLLYQGINKLENFDNLVTEQSLVTLPYEISYVQLFINLLNGQSLLENNNNKIYELTPGVTTLIEFTVKAQDGSLGMTYKISVLRQLPSTESNLLTLNVMYKDITLDLDVNTYIHKLNIPMDVTSILIDATIPDKASITGLGSKLIKHGDLFIISVVAQDKSKTDYLIMIEMYSDDNSISELRINGINQLNNFNQYAYEMNVSYKMTSINIQATAKSSKAIMMGNGTYNLNVGLNLITVYATSESGIKGQTYTIKIIKAAPSSENELIDLIVTDDLTNEVLKLSPVFDSKTTYYVIDLTTKPLVKDINIEAIAKSMDARIIGAGSKQLLSQQGKSSQNFIILVYAEDNSVKTYELLVIRDVNPDDDVSVTEFSLIGDDGINYLGTSNALNAFTSSNKQYIIKVPFSLNNLNINIYNKNGASSNVNGNIVLNLDYSLDTTIKFKMTSKTGIVSEIYTIIVEKEVPNNDSSLKEININNELIKDFSPLVFNYEIIVDSSLITELLIDVKLNNMYQKLSGLNGLKTIDNGLNIFTYTVTAQDGSQSTYKIVIKSLSFDHELLNLSVIDYPFETPYDKNNFNYYLEVPYLVSSIEIEGYANPLSKIDGIGLKQLQVGLNTFNIFVVSQGETKGKTYQIQILRQLPNSDTTLNSLVIKESLLGQTIDFNPVFNKNTLHYTLTIPMDKNLNALFIEAQATSPYALVSGTGIRILEALVSGDYHTILEVTVLAQNGDIGTYTLSIYRGVDLSTDISILGLNLTDNLGNIYLSNQTNKAQLFDKDILFYEIIVPYNVSSINLNVTTNKAKVYGHGQKNIPVNDEVRYDFYVVSEDGSVQSQNYIIHVIREKALHNNDLSGIYIDNILIENFNKDITSYEVKVPKQLKTNIELTAKSLDNSTLITGDIGNHNLNDGKNMFVINASAQNGIIKTYTVNIIYVDSNALLESLILRGTSDDAYNILNSELIDFEFDMNKLEYKIVVDEKIKLVNITGNAVDQNGAQIMGFGTYEVTAYDKEVVIYVRSADYSETITYKVIITNKRIPSSNTELLSVLINGNVVLLNQDGFTYTTHLDKSVNEATIKIEAASPYSKLKILNNAESNISTLNTLNSISREFKKLNPGLNVFIIEVEAEDGSKEIYQVNMIKENQTNELVVMVLITMMILWLSSMIYLFIRKNSRKNLNHLTYLVRTRKDKERD